MLEMLEAVTGLESTYLTTIDVERGTQRILYARNTSEMQIPEGLTVPWSDTLCKRALESGQQCVSDVRHCWSDSQAAAALGIQTYVSTPVYGANQALYGTLCAAGSERRQIGQRAQHVLALFARLISQQIERECLVSELLAANARLSDYAATDALTGIPNRRALLDALTRQLAQGDRQHTTVLVGFMDLDGFKAINDRFGHVIGDEFLIAIARKLQGTLRGQDLVGRYGGDEFVVIGPGPVPGEDVAAACEAFVRRMTQATVGPFGCGNVTIHYAGASMGAVAVAPRTLDAITALGHADQAMYKVKQARKRTAARALPQR